MNSKAIPNNLEEVNSAFTSFFDDNSANNIKFFRSPLKNEENLESYKIIYRACFLKTKKNQSIYKKYYLYMCQDHLLFTKDEKTYKIHKIMSYDCVRINFFTKKDGVTLNGLRFSKNNKDKEFFTDDENIYKNFKKFLSSRCILSTFHEEFEVKKMIGKGSFAKVYLAEHKETSEEFAIKAFNKEFLLTQAKGQESLINEITIMKHLNNKNILKLFEVYETRHSIYLVLEVLKGGELIKKIKEKAIYEEKDVIVVMKHFLEALEHIHDQGIIHRDLKPENLLLRSETNSHDIVIADFGLATFLYNDPQNILFKRCGTPGFVAPEVLSYKDGQEGFYDEKCDIFSAGVIFYLLLTGKKPFVGPDYKQILRANKACQIDFQAAVFKTINSTTMDLLKKMLCAFPQARISAKKALQHPYFYGVSEDKKGNMSPSEYPKHLKLAQDNLNDYMSYQENSKESVGSINITMHKPILNGRIDTLEKLSAFNSNVSLEQSPNPSPGRRFTNSKFSGPPQSGENGEESPSKGMGKKKNNYDDLHKKAIINSLSRNDKPSLFEEEKKSKK